MIEKTSGRLEAVKNELQDCLKTFGLAPRITTDPPSLCPVSVPAV